MLQLIYSLLFHWRGGQVVPNTVLEAGSREKCLLLPDSNSAHSLVSILNEHS